MLEKCCFEILCFFSRDSFYADLYWETSNLKKYYLLEASKYNFLSKCSTHGYYILTKICVFKSPTSRNASSTSSARRSSLNASGATNASSTSRITGDTSTASASSYGCTGARPTSTSASTTSASTSGSSGLACGITIRCNGIVRIYAHGCAFGLLRWQNSTIVVSCA